MVEKEPLTKQSHFFRQSIHELTALTKDLVDGLKTTTLNVEASRLLQERMQDFIIEAFETLESVEKEKTKEVKKRVIWQTIAIAHFAFDVFVAITFIIMLYAARK